MKLPTEVNNHIHVYIVAIKAKNSLKSRLKKSKNPGDMRLERIFTLGRKPQHQ